MCLIWFRTRHTKRSSMISMMNSLTGRRTVSRSGCFSCTTSNPTMRTSARQMQLEPQLLRPRRHYFYGGFTASGSRWFFSHYMYRPYPTVFVTTFRSGVSGTRRWEDRPGGDLAAAVKLELKATGRYLDRPCFLLRVLAVLAEWEGTGERVAGGPACVFPEDECWNMQSKRSSGGLAGSFGASGKLLVRMNNGDS